MRLVTLDSRETGGRPGISLPSGEILDLAPHGPDTFVGAGPRYPWGGLYGGQIVAQALQAATVMSAELIGGLRREQKIIAGLQPRLNDLALPYRYYTDHDIAHRLVAANAYVSDDLLRGHPSIRSTGTSKIDEAPARSRRGA